MANGKAIFNQAGTQTFPPDERRWSGGKGDDLVSIDYPTHALFTDRSRYLIDESTYRKFYSWFQGSNQRDNPNVWTEQVLKDVRAQIANGKFGIFSPAFPRFNQQSSGNGDGFTIAKLGKSVGDQGLIFGRKTYQEGYEFFFKNLLAIPRQGRLQGTPLSADTTISTGLGRDVVMPGLMGNGKVETGGGNDIILSSSQVFATASQDTRKVINTFGSDRLFANNYIYLPIPYALTGSKYNPKGNSFKAGDGNDLIYYDGGTSEAYGDSGNDIFAPSFGSFNWAVDTLIQTESGGRSFGPATWRETDGWRSEDELILFGNQQSPLNGKEYLLSPLTIFDRKQEAKAEDTLGRDFGAFGYNLNYEGSLGSDNPGLANYVKQINKKILSTEQNSGLSSKSGTIFADEFINTLGGQKLYGGNGDDRFYGIDPDFYKGFETAGDGKGLRLAFNRGPNAIGRQHAQIIKPVEMFGGLGSDYFSFGNPSNLDPDKIVGGDYIYRISGNSDSYLDRSSKSFGSKASGDLFEFSLTYKGENWVTNVVSTPGAEGSANTAQEYINGGASAITAITGIANAVGTLTPIWSAIAGVAGFAGSLAGGLFSPKPKQEISREDKFFRDPIGNWRKKTNIQDWDPADAIVINVDPADSNSSTDDRWQNVKFELKPTSDTGSNNALDITYQSSSDKSSVPIIRLENFNDETSQGKGAWFVWNFNEGKRTKVDASHLSFFGQTQLAQKAAPLAAYKDEFGFNVPTGERVFRWTDTSLLNNGQLNKLKTLSEKIIVQLDTRKLGYYWDPRYKGDASSSSVAGNPVINNLQLNLQESRLWYKNNSREWSSYTYNELSVDPMAQRLALQASPVWDTTTPVLFGDSPKAGRRAVDTADTITGIIDGMNLLEVEIDNGIDDLVLSSTDSRMTRGEVRGRLLNDPLFSLKDLNDVVGVVNQNLRIKAVILQ
ncbi:MAG: hypothetical protein WD136_03725 [Cyanobium sp.]